MLNIQLYVFIGPFPEPFLFVATKTKIAVVHLTSTYSKCIIEGRNNSDIKNLEIDPVEQKIYFEDQNRIYYSNFDGTKKSLTSKGSKNSDIWAFALDWMGKRLFWVKSSKKNVIHVSSMDFTYSTDIVTKGENISSLAVDPDAG